MARRTGRSSGASRQYPRTARLNELLREILATELERVEDERLDMVTVVSVETDPEMQAATVFYDSLVGPEGDEEVLEALADARVRLQAAVGRQARTKRVPVLRFAPDPGIRAGERIDSLLRQMDVGEVGDGGHQSPAADPTSDR
jgi:ribosome-binding factor A